MRKSYAIINLLVIILLILWNYGANSRGINGNTVSSVSNQYSNLFTPASWAFSIWGIIFLGLLVHGIYQVKKAFFDRSGDGFITQMGPWLIIANLANGAWVYFWLQNHIWGSVVLMLLILLSLIILIIRLNMERWDAPLSFVAWIWWPLGLYSGWIAVATIANITVALVKIEWLWLFSEITWAIIMIIVAALLNIFMVITRNMREFAAVGIWALVAISVRHWGEVKELHYTAWISALVVLIVISINAYQNRKTNPLTRKTA